VIDASFVPQSGQKSYGLTRCWNGHHGRREKGLEISALAWLDPTANGAYSLSVEQTPPTIEAIDIYLDQLTRVISVSNRWSWNQMRLSLRMATGIPNRNSAVTKDGTTIYTQIEFEDIDRADINLNALFSNINQQQLDVGITVNSGGVRNLFQSKLVHHNLDIPELPQTKHLEVMVYFRLQGF
jgi:hypothetical protein